MAVYIELSKAFDTVNHSILLKKIQNVGVKRRVYDWFRTYLTDRKQYVAVDGMFLTVKVIECGIPQGSNFGQSIF